MQNLNVPRSSADDDQHLLGGAWRPITDKMLFARATPQRIVDVILNGVRGRRVIELYGTPLVASSVSPGPLADRLSAILPLSKVEDRKYLLIATENPEWTVMLGSWWAGFDAFSEMMWISDQGIETVYIGEVPHRPRPRAGIASYGYRFIQSFDDPSGEEPLAKAHAIGVGATSASRWEITGDPEFPCRVGLAWDPEAPRVRDRFTHEHLVEMARRYGLRPFDEDFYPPTSEAVLIERTDPVPENQTPVTLAQAQGLEPPHSWL